MKRKENPMPEQQWPPDWRIECVREDIQKPNMRLYEARGTPGMIQLRVAQEIDRVMAARHDDPTTITAPPTTTKEVTMPNDAIYVDPTSSYIQPKKLKYIPARLDAAAVLSVLSKILSTKFDTIAAATATVTLADIDAGLAQTELSLDDRMRVKFQCAQMGIIGKGRPTSIVRL
jgi:hypothetical protein